MMIESKPMDPISEYQKWKQQGESLRAQAKQAMEGRFRDLLTEAAGKPTKNLEDQLYEVEDDLRLAGQAA